MITQGTWGGKRKVNTRGQGVTRDKEHQGYLIRSQEIIISYLSKITDNAYICTYPQFNELITLKMTMLSMRALDYLEEKRG